ncbi:MAG: cbb3-type cytochrome c oxidase subunit II [Nitrospirae bacterium]|nr:cbb3-type cytochrome c oxidase subunit II [Nitrospirota bacterium]
MGFAFLGEVLAEEGKSLDDPGLIQTGRDLFQEKGCGGCHKLDGAGGEVGPDLSSEGDMVTHDAEWHRSHFKNPSSMAPGSIMPVLGLTDVEIESLTALMLSLKTGKLPKEIETAIRSAREALETARKGIDEIGAAGFNVDALELRYTEGWTRLQTINNMIYTHNLSGVQQETSDAIQISKEIQKGVAEYREELQSRLVQSLVLIALMGSIAVLVFIKVLTV